MTATKNIQVRREGPVLCIIFDRPEKKNALSRDMYLAAVAALQQAESDPEIGAVLFAGSGGVFSAGNDLADFLAAPEELSEPGAFPAFTFIRALASCTTPLVAAIEGIAIGIGATLMLHCDLVYATKGTLFKLPFVDLGLVPEAASSLLLPRRIGMAKASEFLLLGEAFDADEAFRLGLVNRLVPADQLLEFSLEKAKQLAAKPHAALSTTRRLLRGDAREILARIDEEAALFARALRSEEAAAAFSAFFAKPR
ncbi:MAG TPA: enoyl-CoA hydratase-related protein [Methylocella sp.]|nr:enoyl-CoA hydratase-related protein [Methylocella sp.]